jgi:hypothetical protein
MAKNSPALRMSDEAVAAKTGKTWAQWFAILDREGAKNLEHKAIAELLFSRHRVPAWWCQMVTVGYEQAKGKRKIHERPDGWEVSVSRTFALPIAPIYKAWVDAKKRKQWLPSKFEITTASANKSIRIKWNDRERVEVMFYPKGTAKSQMTIQHRRLNAEKEVDETRDCWKAAVERLEKLLNQ